MQISHTQNIHMWTKKTSSIILIMPHFNLKEFLCFSYLNFISYLKIYVSNKMSEFKIN